MLGLLAPRNQEYRTAYVPWCQTHREDSGRNRDRLGERASLVGELGSSKSNKSCLGRSQISLTDEGLCNHGGALLARPAAGHESEGDVLHRPAGMTRHERRPAQVHEWLEADSDDDWWLPRHKRCQYDAI